MGLTVLFELLQSLAANPRHCDLDKSPALRAAQRGPD